MSNNKTKIITKFIDRYLTYIIYFLAAAAILSILLIVISSTIKYGLYLFGLSLVTILFLRAYLEERNYTIKTTFTIQKVMRAIDYLFILSAVVVFVSSIGQYSQLEYVVLGCSIFNTIFLPGWVILRTTTIAQKWRSNAILLVMLIFCISIAISSIIISTQIFLNIRASATVLSFFFLLGSCISPMIHKLLTRSQTFLKEKQKETLIKVEPINLLIIGWTIAFFVYVLISLYPHMLNLLGLDITRHYSSSMQLLSNPELYNSQYPWFHFTLATIIQQSHPGGIPFQFAISFLSIISILCFYAMSKAYLSEIDSRAPLVSTIFFTLFAGFGWFYYIQKLFLSPHILGDFTSLDLVSSDRTYWDISNGQSTWLWLWFRPITVGFAIFFSMLTVMKKNVLFTSRMYIFICSTLLLTLIQIHVSEFFIFTIFLLSIASLFPKLNMRYKETALSALIAISVSGFLGFIYQHFFNSTYTVIPTTLMILLAVISALAIITSHYKKRPKISLKMNLNIIIPVALSLYSIFLFFWFSNASSFRVAEVVPIYSIPWQIYPVLMGSIGIMTMTGILVIFKRFRDNPIIIFVVIFIELIIIGRGLTYVNSSFFDTHYWERRLIIYVFFSGSIISSLIFLLAFDKLRARLEHFTRIREFRYIILASFVSLIVITGSLSTFLTIQYQVVDAYVNGLTGNEKQLQSELNDEASNSVLLTFSDRSIKIAEYKNIGYIVDHYRDQVWPAQNPEIPLKLFSLFNSSSIVFLPKNDKTQISHKSEVANGYVSNLIKSLSEVKKSSDGGAIYEIPPSSSPTPNSRVMLVLPEQQKNTEYNNYYAYDILSQGQYNFTTAFLSDLPTLHKANVIVAPDESTAIEILRQKSNNNLTFKKLIVLNLNGYGKLSKIPVGPPIFEPFADNSSTKWKSLGIGLGRIGLPEVIMNGSMYGNHSRISSNDITSFSVGKGKYSQWLLSRLITTTGAPRDLSQYDRVKFNWYGKDDGKWYITKLVSKDGAYFWYRFRDTWNGWKEVSLPMKTPDTKIVTKLFGVQYSKVTTPGASWNSIVNIEIGSEASNTNANGDYYIDDFQFSPDYNRYNSTQINMNNHQKGIALNDNVGVIPITLGESFKSLSSYNSTPNTPFALYKLSGDTGIYYFNVFPIINKLESGQNSHSGLLKIVTQGIWALSGSDIPKYRYLEKQKAIDSLINPNVIAFKGITTKNAETNMQSNSLIMNLTDPSSITLNIDGIKKTQYGVVRISPLSTESATLYSKELSLRDGSGLYTHALVGNSTITFHGNPAILYITTINSHGIKSGATVTGKHININVQSSSDILMRRPHVSLNGLVFLQDLFGYGSYYNKVRALGQDVRIDGKINFDVQYSDTFTIAKNTVTNGKILLSKPSYAYDETGVLVNILSLPYIIRYSITLLLLVVIFNVYIRKKTVPKLPS